MKYAFLKLFQIFPLISSIISLTMKTNSFQQRTKDFSLFESFTEEFKKSVVMITINSDLKLMDEESTNSQATGFIVDKELGLIATNKHVTRIGPTKHKINFYDGSTSQGTVVYYDFYHDFGFIQLDFMRVENKTQIKENEIYKKLKPISLGSSYDLQVGDELMLIGNNEGVNFSIKYGNVVALNSIDPLGSGSIIETSFDRSGGSSGSPVWNKEGKVVAIHAMGNTLSSFEVPIEYIKAALEKMKNTTKFEYDKGFLGITVNLLPFYQVENILKNLNQTKYSIKELKLTLNESKKYQRDLKHPSELIQISSVMLNSTSYNQLRAGDIIIKINEQFIGNDLILYEKLVDENAGRDTKIQVFRFGELIEKVVKVDGTEKQKIKKFIKFSNTIIHEITDYVRFFNNLLERRGLYISQLGLNSPFQEIVTSKGGIVLNSINSIYLNTLDDLVNALERICDRQNIYVEIMDLSLQFPKFTSYPIDLGDLSEIYIFEVDPNISGWKSKGIKLKDCENSKINIKENPKRSSSEDRTQSINKIKANIKYRSLYLMKLFS
jgi:S1-C subfamily serine protease